MLLALNAIRPDKNNNPPKAVTIRIIKPMAFTNFESTSLSTAEEISIGTADKPRIPLVVKVNPRI